MARDGDVLLVHVIQRQQVIEDTMIPPGPRRQPPALVIGIGREETLFLRIVRCDLLSAEFGQDIAALGHFRNDLGLYTTPSQVARDDHRKRTLAGWDCQKELSLYRVGWSH